MPTRSENVMTVPQIHFETAVFNPGRPLTQQAAKLAIDYADEHYPDLTWTMAALPLVEGQERMFEVRFSVTAEHYVKAFKAPAVPKLTEDEVALVLWFRAAGFRFRVGEYGVEFINDNASLL